MKDKLRREPPFQKLKQRKHSKVLIKWVTRQMVINPDPGCECFSKKNEGVFIRLISFS